MSDALDGKAKIRMANTLTRVATFLGGLGALTMLIKLKMEISPAMKQVLFYPGLFATAAVLILLSAWYGREGRRELAESQKQNELASGSEGQLGFMESKDRLKEER